MKRTLPLLMLLYGTASMHAVQLTTSIDHRDATHQIVNVNFQLDDNEVILENSLHATVDHEQIQIHQPHVNIVATKEYLRDYQQKKKVFAENFTATIGVDCQPTHNPIHATVHLSYLSTNNSGVLDIAVPVTFESAATLDEAAAETHHSISMPAPQQLQHEHKDQSWAATMQNMVETTKSPWAQILFALLLGLLLSLTPCIYPMIPITIGILHSQGRKSLFYDFLGSLSYACGLATTFACLGLVATVAGSSFGSLLSNTPFVICLVMFIGYMSLTMIGIIDMYVPSFMKGEVRLHKNLGPCAAAFLFGAISGTVASPCVSPGLALLLSIVATLGSKILGFLLLFAFGIGLSTPLIIIGTFSNSLYLLPKSGMWMVEIKKALGFFMLATCFYYLANVLPIAIVYWLFTSFCLFTAYFYLVGIGYSSNEQYKKLHTLIGIIMIGLSIFIGTKSYEKTFYTTPITQSQSVQWQENYAIALDQAQENNKLLLIDFWANHCTICKAIDKKVFHNDQFNKALQDLVTFVKVDATHSNNPDYVQLREQYKVYAQPTILIVDPVTQTVLKKWTSEPYSMPIEELIQAIQALHLHKK